MKTLNEFYILTIKKTHLGERLAKFRKTVDKEELRQSAIDDIKVISKNTPKVAMILKWYIMVKFNITEDDLK